MSDLTDQMIDELQQAAIGNLEWMRLKTIIKAMREAVKSRDQIGMLEREVSFIRDKLAERDAHMVVLRGDIQRQSGIVNRLIEERDELRKLLAEVKQERDHWLRKCKDLEAASLSVIVQDEPAESELERKAWEAFLSAGLEQSPSESFRLSSLFLAERNIRRKNAEVTNEN